MRMAMAMAMAMEGGDCGSESWWKWLGEDEGWLEEVRRTVMKAMGNVRSPAMS